MLSQLKYWYKSRGFTVKVVIFRNYTMRKTVMWLIVIPALSFVSLLILMPHKSLRDVPLSTAIYAADGTLLRLTLSADDKYRIWVPLTEISKYVQQTTLLEEDQYFYHHVGVNPFAFGRAIYSTFIRQHRRMGASTLTMQVARLRYSIHSKSIPGKLNQIFRALQLELFYSKQDILEAYFNLAPFGHNIEGIGAASLIYFDKSAKDLNLVDSLTLSVMPQHPAQRLQALKALQRSRHKLFLRWVALHPQDIRLRALIDLSLQLKSFKAVTFSAPHFVNQVLEQYAPSPAIHTTLNLAWQHLIENCVKNYVREHTVLGIKNASVLLVNTENMQVETLVGSADFFSPNIDGQINGTHIKRSPGSTLKPFIYGLAIDQGLIHPNSILADVPISFGNYNPENFDNQFLGPLTAHDALLLSRNIPAVNLAARLHAPNLFQFLQAAKVGQLRSENYYGLTLALGGAEVTMQELVSMYGALNNHGIWQPLQFTQNYQGYAQVKLLSPESAYLILDMLNQNGIAYKTGTSANFHDAWSIAVFGHYVLAVWVGNFNQQTNTNLVGNAIATPLMLTIVHQLHANFNLDIKPIKPSPKLHMVKLPICKASGMLPTVNCVQTTLGWFIPGKSPIAKDTVFKSVAINPLTGLQTCHINAKTRFEIYEFWPSDFLQLFKRAGFAKKMPPAFEPGCQQIVSEGLMPEVILPKKNLVYVISKPSKKLPFKAVVDADVKTLYWFVNNKFVGASLANQVFYWQGEEGVFVVRVADDHGRVGGMELKVLST